jgi:hypothetical protein
VPPAKADELKLFYRKIAEDERRSGQSLERYANLIALFGAATPELPGFDDGSPLMSA